MKVSPLLDFKVKSSIHDYEVKFVENVSHVLKSEIRYGDVIIIDNKVKNLYPDLLKGTNNIKNVIDIDASEDQKSYQGLIPIIHSIAPFVVDRCFEQLKCDVCYQKLPVNIVSVGASYDYAGLGCTHHCPGDIATLKTLPGMEIIVPGTPEEFDLLFSETYSNDHPTYYRLSENSNSINFPVKFGYANVIQSGSLATVLAVGPALRFVLKAVEDLDVTLIYYTTVEPFDIGTLLNNSISNKYIIIEPYYSSGLSAEIHNAFGNNPLTIKNIAVPKIFLTNYGRSEDHDEKLGFNIENIRFTINSFINE